MTDHSGTNRQPAHRPGTETGTLDLEDLAPIDPHYARTRVYFIACGEFVKIGVTDSLKKRFVTLQTSTPYDLELLYAMPGNEDMEEFLHYRFNAHHHRGEWFRLHQDILDFIERHKSDPDAALFEGVPGISR